jgi:hypothetical protein
VVTAKLSERMTWNVLPLALMIWNAWVLVTEIELALEKGRMKVTGIEELYNSSCSAISK